MPDDLTRRGKLIKSIAVACAIFEHEFKIKIRRNDFFGVYEILDPERAGQQETWRALQDPDLRSIRNKVGHTYQDEFSGSLTHDALMAMGDKCPCDPLIEALEALTWDGMPRVNTWLTTYLGCAPDLLTISKGRRWLIGAVSRAMLNWGSRGSKVDTALILVGGQGTLKSTVFSVLAETLVPWSYLDDFHFGMEAKETLEQTNGKFLVEDAEIRMLGQRGRGNVKQSLSKRSDKARMAYERITIERPRRFVIVGTSNQDDFLEDPTGSRRFWIVRTNKIDIEALKRDAGQLWAEAKTLWEAGEKWWFDASEEGENDRQNLDYMPDDPLIELLRPKLGSSILDGEGYMSTEGILKLIALPLIDTDNRTTKRLAQIMRQLGFERERVTLGGKKSRGYVRGDWIRELALNGGKEMVDTSNIVVVEKGKTVQKRDDSIL